MEGFNKKKYVIDMYNDKFYPPFLVDKIKCLLMDGVQLLESGERNKKIIQKKFDEIMRGINNLQDEFYEHESEIEAAARKSIFKTVKDITSHFHLTVDAETLMREREW
jgi:hypothetical protein